MTRYRVGEPEGPVSARTGGVHAENYVLHIPASRSHAPTFRSYTLCGRRVYSVNCYPHTILWGVAIGEPQCCSSCARKAQSA